MCGRDDDPTQHVDRTAPAAGGRVRLTDRMLDRETKRIVADAGSTGLIDRVDLGIRVSLVVTLDSGRSVRVEPMDVEWPKELEDGTLIWPQDADPDADAERWCRCGMRDAYGVVDGNDCRAVGCDPSCTAEGCVA